MTTNGRDVRSGEQTGGLPDTVLELFSEDGATPGTQPRPPDSCASCGGSNAIQWLRMVADWEDSVCETHGISRPEGVCLIPLCNRCRAWAEIIEIAEMAVPQLPEAEGRRIVQERERFLETLDVNLIRGIRVSEELSSFTE